MSEYNFTTALICNTEKKMKDLINTLQLEEPYPEILSPTILKEEKNILYATWGASITENNNGAESDIPQLLQNLLTDGVEEIYGLHQDEHDESGMGEFVFANGSTDFDPGMYCLATLIIFSGEEDGSTLFRKSDIRDGTEAEDEDNEFFYIDDDNIHACFSLIISKHKSGELTVPSQASEKTGIDEPVGDEGETLLMWAAEDGNLEKIESLIHQGASIHATDDRGFTPLFYAVCSITDRPHVVKFLLEQGAEVNTSSHSGVTPLMRAAFGKNPKTLQLLIDSGAEINSTCDKHYTPLIFAVRDTRENNLEMSKILIDSGADVNVKDKTGGSVLWHAICYGSLEVIELLIGNGVAIKPVKKYLKTAREHKRQEVIEILTQNT